VGRTRTGSRRGERFEELGTDEGRPERKGDQERKARSIGLDDFALDLLRGHREEQKQDKATVGLDYQNINLIFCGPTVSSIWL
jgi:hypothetical protein